MYAAKCIFFTLFTWGSVNFKYTLWLEALAVVLFVQDTSINFRVGTQVYVEDPEEAWIEGEVVETNGVEIKVKCVSDKTVSLINCTL